MDSGKGMGWAEVGLLLADRLRSWGEEVGSARSVSSPGGRTFRPEKPAWGFPRPLQYNRPLDFGNLARRVRGLEAFTNTHPGKTTTRTVPFPVPSTSGRETTTQPRGEQEQMFLGPARPTLLGEPEGLAESIFWVKLGGVLSLRLWAR